MKRRAFPVVFLVVLSIMGGSAVHVAAQEGTPVVLPSGLPVTPDPSECTVQARSIDEIMADLGVTPVASTPSMGMGEEASPVASPEAFTLPEGEAADNATVEAITATLREVLACINAGNFLVFFEFISDNLLQEFTAEPISEEDVAFLRGTPEALDPALYASLVAVREVTMLPDGRVGALVETIFPEEEPGIQVDYFFFVEEDGRWLIDELVEDLEDQFPPASATPTA